MTSATIVRGNIITMDPQQPRAEAFVTANGRILYVGSADEAAQVAGRDASRIDYDEGAVIPGLIDTHNHMLYTGLQKRLVDLSGCKSVEDILDTIRAYAARRPEAQWITSGLGWQIESFPDPRYPTRQELDLACPDRPLLLNRGNHVGVANSKALALAGITSSSPNPEGGHIVKDDCGEPTGLLLEAPAFELVSRLIPPPSRSERKAALIDAQALYHAAGLCGVIDPGLGSDDMSIYQELWQEGGLTVRTVAMPLAQTHDEVDALLAKLGAWGVRTGFGDERMKLGGFKLFIDGGATLGTALMREPFPDERCNCGVQVTHTTTFHRIAEFCAKNGWSLGVHAVGGKAIDIALAVFGEVNERFPIAGLRFQIIHGYLWPSAQNIADAKRLGVTVATQPNMQYNFAPQLVQRFGAKAFGEATPIRSWLDGGVKVGGGSDSPVNSYDPLLGIWHAVTRYVDKLESVVGEQEAITPEEALAMYTRDAAFLAFSEHERGMIRAGMLADWVALSLDPLACPARDIRHARVLATVVGGRIVYQRQQ